MLTIKYIAVIFKTETNSNKHQINTEDNEKCSTNKLCLYTTSQDKLCNNKT